MDELTYLDFDLWIGRTAEGYVAKSRDSHGREATEDFRMPCSELEVEDFWRRIGLHRSRARRHAAAPNASDQGRRPDFASLDEASKSYGGSLFEALFHGDLLSCFRSSLDHATREHAGLRIRLRLADVPKLANLPWEYLYDTGSDRFVALSVETPVVRYLELTEPLQPLAVRPPLRMLVMVASPSDYDRLDVEEEWRRLNDALGDHQRRGLIQLERLKGTTLKALQDRLRRGGAHVFHFIGHGDFDQRSQEGVLILEGESGRGRPVSGKDLGGVLHDKAPRLVILNTCKGARTSSLNPFAGVAQTLIQQGVPAVVAMQTEILDDFALTLVHELYGALADGYPIDACLAEARKSLAGQKYAAWGTPVLYLRAPDGRILDLKKPWLKWAGLLALVLASLLLLVSGPWRDPGRGEERASICHDGEEVKAHGIFFVRICAGTSLIAPAPDDSQAHEVERPVPFATLDEFWIGKYEITNEEYRHFQPEFLGQAELPASGLSWTEAKAFCEHFGFRLPTEAEWEFAARAGSQATWSFGDDVRQLDLFAWSDSNSGGQIHPVGTRKPNAWGLHDMHGNVWEWVGDTFETSSRRHSDIDRRREDLPDTKRILRGGAFNQNPSALRSAGRYRVEPSYRFGPIGFRCAMDSSPLQVPLF